MSGKGGSRSESARIRRGPATPRKRVTSSMRGGRAVPVRQSSASRALAAIPAPIQAHIRLSLIHI